MKPTRLAFLLGVVASLPVLILLGFCVGSPRYYSAKYSPATGLSPPTPLPLAIIPVNSLHWLVLVGIEGDDVIIADSLAEKPYTEPLDAYVRGRVLSAILLRPRE